MNLLISRYRYSLALLVVLCLSVPAWAQEAPRDLAAKLDSILSRHDTDAYYAARVVRLSDGAELYAHDIDRPMIPASNMKLPVSSAALDHFGADATLDTYLGLRGDDLVVVGTGDPAFGDPRVAGWKDQDIYGGMDAWAEALKERGISRIEGDLVFDDSALPPPRVERSWDEDDLVYWYAAPVSGLNFNDNCIDVTARPAEMGQPATLEVTPATTDTIHIVNLSRSTEEPGEEIDIERTHIANVYAVVGDVHKEHEFISRPVVDPGLFFADVLRTRLAEKGIEIAGEIRRSEEPIDPQSLDLVATHRTELPHVLTRINTNSQNLFAEAMSKRLGKAVKGTATWEAGNEAIVEFMKANGIDPTGFEAVDGSGLSRRNRVTVRQLTELMRLMHEHEEAEVFRDSLTHGGKNGTLASRFKDAPGTVRGKTGYIGGVRALTVYATPEDGGETYIVSVLYNGIPGSVKPFEALQDEAIVEVLRSAPRAATKPATSARGF